MILTTILCTLILMSGIHGVHRKLDAIRDELRKLNKDRI